MSTPAPAPAPQKRRKLAHAHPTKLTSSTNKATSAAALKKKVRDLERLLAHHTNLPADVRLNNERALEAFRYELNLAKKSVRDGKIDKKYQMVRFFERQKATRKLKKLQKQAATESSPSESLQKDLHTAQIDLNYILYYPKGEKYISLFKDPGEHIKVLEKRNMIRKDIERQIMRETMRSGATVNSVTMDEVEVIEKEKDNELGEARQDGEKRDREKRERKGQEGINKKKRKKNKEEAAAGENDDGFFEF